MKVMDTDKRIKEIEEFLSEQGVGIKNIAVSDLGEEGILVRVFTNLKSLNRARELELELLEKGIETEDFTVIINTQT